MTMSYWPRLPWLSIIVTATMLVTAQRAVAESGTATEIDLQLQVTQQQPGNGPAHKSTGQAAPAKEAGVQAKAADGDLLLGLEQAISRALESSPAIAGLRQEQRVLDSLAWQEGRKPNPEVELELEEFGGTQEASGISALATSITYSQPLERGGKRALREMTARLESGLVNWDIAELRHEIQAGVRLAYASAQASQFELEQLARYRELLQHIYDTVSTSVEAGRSARLELERLDIELARMDLEIASAQRSRRQAFRELAIACGGLEVDFDSVEPSAGIPELPALDWLREFLHDHPAVARFSAERDAVNALIELENANSVPDIELFGGVTRLSEIQETVFKVGVAMELPVHDRNEGSINAAFHRRDQLEIDRRTAMLELEQELISEYGMAGDARDNYLEYGTELLPAAMEALALTEEGYHYGKFELLDVLDAQRTVLELESEQTAALVEYMQHIASIEALLGSAIDAQPPAAFAASGGAGHDETASAAVTEESDNEKE